MKTLKNTVVTGLVATGLVVAANLIVAGSLPSLPALVGAVVLTAALGLWR